MDLVRRESEYDQAKYGVKVILWGSMPHEQEGYAEEMNEHAQEELDTIQDQECESNFLVWIIEMSPRKPFIRRLVP